MCGRPNPFGEARGGGHAMTCSFDGCAQDSKARGYCSGHYAQLLRGQDLRPTRRRFPLENLLDVLELEGGWWTAEGLSLRLGYSTKTVETWCRRLAREGVLRVRYLQLAYGEGNKLEARTEWAA